MFIPSPVREGSTHWTVWTSIIWPSDSWTGTVQPLDSWSKQSLTIWLLFDTQLTSHRTAGNSIDQPLNCWTQHCPTIGKFDRALSNILTIGHSTVPPLDCWTQHCLNTCINSCPTIGNMKDYAWFTSPNCLTEENLSNLPISCTPVLNVEFINIVFTACKWWKVCKF